MIAIVGATLAGRSLLALFDRVCGTQHEQRPPAEVAGLSILLGVSFTAAAAFVWSDVGRPLTSRFSWGQVALGGVLGSLAMVMAARRANRSTATILSAVPTRVTRFCQVALGLTIAAVFIQTFVTPTPVSTERVMLATKAKVLYETGTIDAPPLTDLGDPWAHPRHPLMLPLLERHVYALCGEVNDRSAKVWFPLTYAGLVLCFAGVLSRRTSPEWGWLMATILAISPLLMPDGAGFLSRMTDAPLACFHGVAVLCLLDGLQEPPGAGRRRGVLLASALASSAVFVKDEGLAFLIADVCAWGMAVLLGAGRLNHEGAEEGRLRSVGRHLFGMLAFALFAAILLTPWMRYRAALPTTQAEMHYSGLLDFGHIAEWFSTLRWTLPTVLHRIFLERPAWGIPWWLLLITLVIAPHRSWAGPQRLLLLTIVGAHAITELLAPTEIAGPPGGTGLRHLMQLVPVAFLFVAATWPPKVAGLSESGVPTPRRE